MEKNCSAKRRKRSQKGIELTRMYGPQTPLVLMFLQQMEVTPYTLEKSLLIHFVELPGFLIFLQTNSSSKQLFLHLFPSHAPLHLGELHT